ncbi:MAG: hypothetical protein LRY71_01380 [Bacillaceae bacterium]|nr:hypothetical protein [Bacillaceae bacterium]
MDLFKNEYLLLTSDANDDVYISVKEKGFDIKEFNIVLKEQPRISINKITELRKALIEATGQEIKIGTLNPRIEVFISNDKMKAEVKANITYAEFYSKQPQVIAEVVSVLEKSGVREGIMFNCLQNGFTLGKKVCICKGDRTDCW